MRKILMVFIVIVSFFTVSSFTCNAGEVLDKVVAIVNDEPILQSELDKVLAAVYAQYKKQFEGDDLYSKLDEARKEILNQLIEDKLIYQEAVELGLEITEGEIADQLASVKEQFGDEEKFNEFLSTQGLSVSKLEERLKQQVAIRKMHHYHVRSRVIVTPKEIENYYNENIKLFTAEESIKVRTITIRKNEKGRSDEEAKAITEEILRKNYTGEKFEDLAKEYSEDTKAESGGDLGYVARGDLIPEIEKVIFSLKSGEMSPVIETEMGFHLFMVEEKQAKRTKTFNEVREKIKDMLYHKQTVERFKEWMAELKSKAYISIR